MNVVNFFNFLDKILFGCPIICLVSNINGQMYKFSKLPRESIEVFPLLPSFIERGDIKWLPSQNAEVFGFGNHFGGHKTQWNKGNPPCFINWIVKQILVEFITLFWVALLNPPIGKKLGVESVAKQALPIYFAFLYVTYCAGKSFRWYIAWSVVKGTRNWFRGLVSPHCWIPVNVQGVWAASWVRQGLDCCPLTLLYHIYWKINQLDRWKYVSLF